MKQNNNPQKPQLFMFHWSLLKQCSKEERFLENGIETTGYMCERCKMSILITQNAQNDLACIIFLIINGRSTKLIVEKIFPYLDYSVFSWT
jgi:hypothetical protein